MLRAFGDLVNGVPWWNLFVVAFVAYVYWLVLQDAVWGPSSPPPPR